MPLPSTADLLAAFASAFLQQNRLLKLRFGLHSGIDEETLLPQRIKGSESINDGFRYELTCLSNNAFIELKTLIGQPLEVSILTDANDYRPITGWITAARAAGSDGGFARYVLVIEDLFALLAHRINQRVFQDLSAKDAFLTIVREHQAANPILADSLDIDDRTTRDYPTQSWITQYNESDAAFGKRRLFQEGINFFFTVTDGNGNDHPTATLVLFDDNAQLADNAAGKVRYHRADGTEDTDAITAWNNERTLAPGGIAAASYDYKPVNVTRPSETSRLDQGETGNALATTLEDYRFDVSHYGNDSDDYQRYADLRMQAHEYNAKRFSGESTVRAFGVGSRFTLTDHPEIDQHNAIDRAFILTGLEIEAENNLLGGLKAPSKLTPDARLLKPGSPYTNTFTTSRDTVRLVPEYRHTEHARPSAPQHLTGIVVGPEAEEIYTDSLGRIKVNFQFPRAADHQAGGASYNHNDSPWLRVAQTWASSEYGALFLPRVGDEVNINFINGDIDRPIVMGTVYNGTHHPATFSHAGDLPGNKTLSGVKSKMYKGVGANELVLDDSTNEQRIRVATDHGHTALNQGYLVHPRVEGKGTPRGEGFELRTDASGSLRAALGVLISTDARRIAHGSQLDRQEFIGQIELAKSLLKNLSDLSTSHHAEDTDSKPQEQLLDHIKHWEAGSNTDSSSPSPSQGEGRGEGQSGGQPIVAISGQAGIALSTPQNTTMSTGTNLDMVAMQDMSISTGRSIKARAKEMVSLFSHKLGMKLIAASGKIDIQAHSDNIEITSAKKVIITGLEGIELKAPKITYIAQGAGTVWGESQILSKTLGSHTVHATDHKLTGPAGVELTLPKMPRSKPKGAYPFSL
ncbi:MAG: type VI secretion system Vgr family protein [Burkholderiales bacterium]|nr:type VI secretion system Vgr family protein [Burkholderiales bacterium]